MFFKRAKKRWAAKNIEMVNQLKMILFSILAVEYKISFYQDGESDNKSYCEQTGSRYASLVVNRLFGHSNEDVVKSEEDFWLFTALDEKYNIYTSVVLNREYPELKLLITDALIRYYKAFEKLGKINSLHPKKQVFLRAFQMNLIYIDEKDFRVVSDSEFVNILNSIDAKRKNLDLKANQLFNAL